MSRVEISQRSTRHEHMPNLASPSRTRVSSADWITCTVPAQRDIITDRRGSGQRPPKGKSGSGLFIEAVEYLGDQACC